MKLCASFSGILGKPLNFEILISKYQLEKAATGNVFCPISRAK